MSFFDILARISKSLHSSLLNIAWIAIAVHCHSELLGKGFFLIFSQNGGVVNPFHKTFVKSPKLFFACQIHPKILNHVLQRWGSDVWSIWTLYHHSKVTPIIVMIRCQNKKLDFFWHCQKMGGVNPCQKTLWFFTDQYGPIRGEYKKSGFFSDIVRKWGEGFTSSEIWR